MESLLKLTQIHQSYHQQEIIKRLSLELKKGEIGCLLGPSGCGKTTVLRCIAGFESISSGEITINGKIVCNADFNLPPEQRRIGMVFQDYALFPHLSVSANIGFGLQQYTKAERTHRINELITTVGLTEASDRYPHELSGGQQQRVALARALAPRPDLLLLDEPFSNLDISLRERLSLEVRDILKDQHTTAILVTHDQTEAFSVADVIGVMHQGEILQWDTAYNLYHHPTNRFVAQFIGQGTFVPGHFISPEKIQIALGIVENRDYSDYFEQSKHTINETVDVLLRPDDIVYNEASTLQATVVNKAFRGANILYTLKLSSGQTLLSLIPSHHNHSIGESIGIQLAADHVVVFSREKM
ncbi:MAG: ABC transporter ATP-binding protein [Nitrosomonas sp.]